MRSRWKLVEISPVHLAPRPTGFTLRPLHSGLLQVEVVADEAAGRPFPPSFHSSAAPYPPHFAFMGSQYLAAKNRPNLFTSLHFAVHLCLALGRGDAPMGAQLPPLPPPRWGSGRRVLGGAQTAVSGRPPSTQGARSSQDVILQDESPAPSCRSWLGDGRLVETLPSAAAGVVVWRRGLVVSTCSLSLSPRRLPSCSVNNTSTVVDTGLHTPCLIMRTTWPPARVQMSASSYVVVLTCSPWGTPLPDQTLPFYPLQQCRPDINPGNTPSVPWCLSVDIAVRARHSLFTLHKRVVRRRDYRAHGLTLHREQPLGECLQYRTKLLLRPCPQRYGKEDINNPMEQSWNEGTWEKGDPRENLLTSGIVRRNSHLRKSGASSLTAESPRPPYTKWCSLMCSSSGVVVYEHTQYRLDNQCRKVTFWSSISEREKSRRCENFFEYGVTRSRLRTQDGNTARLARRSDETLGVPVSVARIAPSLLTLDREEGWWRGGRVVEGRKGGGGEGGGSIPLLMILSLPYRRQCSVVLQFLVLIQYVSHVFQEPAVLSTGCVYKTPTCWFYVIAVSSRPLLRLVS
ncbi:hypothetical protein PR048_026425 [Dryococelus australis]|uniref:Uncharacterized protein n=1 Tax=Dryococelus australis TaxID=614101 RepID=A0ABQ9GL97_9NEOP|nr:hypothetical protein PR048_026425 [Dryococelus australis]